MSGNSKLMAIIIFGFALIFLGWSSMNPPFVLKIKRINPEAEEPQATFPHLFHHTLFKCTDCHPSTFPAGSRGMVHDDFDKGEYCGACHNGKISFAADDDEFCEICHK